jgi:hypothetical protein
MFNHEIVPPIVKAVWQIEDKQQCEECPSQCLSLHDNTTSPLSLTSDTVEGFMNPSRKEHEGIQDVSQYGNI